MLVYREEADLLEVHKLEKPRVTLLLFAQFTQMG